MKLSLSNCSLNRLISDQFTWESAMKEFRNSGFTVTDFDISSDALNSLPESAQRARRILSESGVTAAQAHAPCINPLEFKSEGERIALIDSFRFCKEAGIPALVVHPGATKDNTEEEFFERNAVFYRSLIPVMEETGVKLLIENIGNYADPYYLKNGEALRMLVDMTDHPLAFACWDVGHANHFYAEDCDQYTSILALGDKLGALHVHDNCGYFNDSYRHHRIDMHSMPYASLYMSVNYDKVLKGLVDIGYSGSFNFESIVGNPSINYEEFVLNGTVYDKLLKPSIGVWKAYNRALYEAGKFMLSEYDVFEG